MAKKFFVTELVDCRFCDGVGKEKNGNPCLMCLGTGKAEKKVSLEEALKEFLVDVLNTEYFGIIQQRKDKKQ